MKREVLERVITTLEAALEQDRNVTIEKAEITAERLEEIFNGSAASVKETYNLTKSLQANYVYMAKYMGMSEIDSYDNDKLLVKAIDSQNVDELLDEFITGRLLRTSNGLILVCPLHYAKSLPDEVSNRLVKCFYDNGMVKAARELSGGNVYVRFDNLLDKLKQCDVNLFKYIFGSTDISSPYFTLCGYFYTIYNGCNSEEKHFLTEIMHERFDAVKKLVEKNPVGVSIDENSVRDIKGKEMYLYSIPNCNKLDLNEEDRLLLETDLKEIQDLIKNK